MLKKFTIGILMVTVFAFLGLMGCAQEEETGEMSAEAEKAMMMKQAVAEMNPTEGNEVTGTVTFTATDNGVRVVAHFENVSPGKHGFHIHEFGDCSAPDATSAGGHYNPTDMPHAGRNAEQRHVGDLGNLTADQDGVAHADFVDPVISLEGPNSIVGKAVILHSGEDDLTTQPTGDAGARLACGVIELVEEQMSEEEDMSY